MAMGEVIHPKVTAANLAEDVGMAAMLGYYTIFFYLNPKLLLNKP